MQNKIFCPISSQMWITQGGGGLDRKSKFVATNLSHKTPNFCSKNSLKNQANLKIKISKFLLKKQNNLNVNLYNLKKNRNFSNLKNINLDNCLLNNQVKHNISNTHFGNLKNIKFYFRNIKHNIKNLIYFRHILNVSFRVYCRRLN